MRILLFPASYVPVLGGLQVACRELAGQFQKAGHEMRVATQRYPRNLPAEEVMNGITVRRWLFLRPEIAQLRCFRPDLFLAGLYFTPVVTRQMRVYFQEFRPDLVNVHFPDEQTAFVLKMRQYHPFRLVVSLHGHEIDRWEHISNEIRQASPAFKRLQRLLTSADAVTACSDALLKKAVSLFPEIETRSAVIFNGIDLSRFQDAASYSHPRPYLFNYGRLIPKKGVDLLLEAYAQVTHQIPDVDLIIAGDGEEKQRLREQARKLGIDHKVTFFGRATPEEVVRLLNGSLLVVIPSRQEPFGITVLEAMAAGKPVLATRVGGIPEFLPEKGNLLVSPDVDSIAQGLARMLSALEKPQELPANRQQAAHFTWELAGQKYLQLF